MRPLWIGLVLVVAAAFLFLTPASGAQRRPACSSAGSKTVKATERARVFSKRGRLGSYRVTRLYGCLYGRNARFRLSILGEPGIFVTSVPHIRLVGNFVGYAEEYEGPAGGRYGQIRVRSLRTGVESFTETGAPPDSEDITTTRNITDLELRATGAAAWIVEVPLATGAEQSTFQVHMRGAGGRTMLDAGPDVVPDSLALSGSTLYWTRGGLPRSARLQ